MTEVLSDYVFIDGVTLHKDVIIKMAMNCGNPVVVEHFIPFLMNHAFKYKKQDIIEKVNEIRESYHLMTFASDKPTMSTGKYDPNFNMVIPPDIRARNIYKKLKTEECIGVLRSSLVQLRLENENLFNFQLCWAGIFFVVRDRLGCTIKKNKFHEFAIKFTPEDWPDDLRISESTLSNVNRKIDAADRNEAYYDMANNPWEELCEKFWSYVLSNLLTKE